MTASPRPVFFLLALACSAGCGNTSAKFEVPGSPFQVEGSKSEGTREDPEGANLPQDPHVAAALLRLEQARLAAGRYAALEGAGPLLRDALARARAHLRRIGRPWVPREGLEERALLSPIDGSPQPFLVYVPKGLRAGERRPLVVYLHGYASDTDKLNWVSWFLPEGLLAQAEKRKFLVAVPFGRGNTDFRGPGKADLLQVLDLALREYPADPDRVVLFGYSMGGSGAWSLCADAPDLFAGLVAAAGRTDYHLWHGLKREETPRFERRLIDADFAASRPGNFRGLPVHILHGALDEGVQPEQSRSMRDLLAKEGQRPAYREFPEEGHLMSDALFGEEPLFDWIMERRRGPAERARHLAFTPDAGRAEGAAILAFEGWDRPASFEIGRGEGGAVEIRTENVACLSLDLRRWAPPGAERARLKINGRPAEAAVGRAPLRLGDAPEEGKAKAPGLAGPVRAAYEAPFTIVYGTSGTREANEESRSLAEREAREWRAYAQGEAKPLPDREVTAELMQERHLVLCGPPSANLLLRGMARELPIGIEDGAFDLLGRRFEGEVGLKMVHPNPLVPRRLVVIHSGVPWGAALPPNHKLDLIPDFIVYGRNPRKNGGNDFHAAGFFDANWKLDPALVEFGEPPAR